MGFFSSLSKSRKLRSISKRLAGDPNRALTMEDVTGQSSYVKDQQAAMSDLLDLVEGDANLRAVMRKHGANRSHLENAYELLGSGGCGQWASGHWVAASALAFPATLDFVLRHTVPSPNSININTTGRVIEYFERGKTGPVDE